MPGFSFADSDLVFDETGDGAAVELEDGSGEVIFPDQDVRSSEDDIPKED